MAWSRIQGNAAHSSSGSSITVTLGAGISAGDLVVGTVTWDIGGGQTLSSVQDNAGSPNTYTVSDTVNDSGNGQAAASFFFVYTGSGGPTTVTATFSSSTSTITMVVTEYSGVNNVSDPRDGHTGNLFTGSNPVSNSITTTTNGDLIWGGVASTGALSPSITAGSGFTLRDSDFVQVSVAGEDLTQGTASSGTTSSFTATNTNYAIFVIAFSPAGGGGGGDTLFVGGGIHFI